jgi:hypothetical protein
MADRLFQSGSKGEMSEYQSLRGEGESDRCCDDRDLPEETWSMYRVRNLGEICFIIIFTFSEFAI